MKRLMFVTVGTSPGVVESVAHSVRDYNPDHVVLLSSERGRRATVEAIRTELGFDAYASEESGERWTYSAPEGGEAMEGILDVEGLQLVYRQIIDAQLALHDAEAEHAVADFTHGTRPMSIALFQAAYSRGVRMLAYVSGERDESTGEVIPGTETTHEVYGRRLRAFDRLQEAVEQFNRGEYSAARQAAEAMASIPAIHLPHGGDGRALVATAATAFEAWDRFRLEEALEELQKLGDEEVLDPEFAARHLVGVRRREAVLQRHLAMAINRPMDFGLLADVVANADRRIGECAWDDAVGRLYRALEYVAQLRIWEVFEEKTAAFPVERLSEALRGRLAPEAEAGESCTLSMRNAWRLLEADGDELAARFVELLEETELEGALRKRNHSILAHGFESVRGEYARVLRQAVDQLARAGWGTETWEEALDACDFPRIEGL